MNVELICQKIVNISFILMCRNKQYSFLTFTKTIIYVVIFCCIKSIYQCIINTGTSIPYDYFRGFSSITNIMYEKPQYPEDGTGLYTFNLYRNHSGKTDISFSEFVNLNLEIDFWNQKKEFPVPISEEVTRDSGLFNHRRSFICWVSPEILKKFELADISVVDTKDKFLRVTLDFDELVKAWTKEGYSETWKPQTTENS